MQNYHKSIVFSKVPLTGHFRFLDIFQIYPADFDGIPKSKYQRHFPLIVEYWTDKDESIVVPELFEEIPLIYTDLARKLNKLDTILSLLSVFSNHLFFRYKDSIGNWTLPILKEDAGKEANSWSSKWGLYLYSFPEMADHLKITGFSEQSHGNVELVEHFSYYLDDPNVDSDYNKVITFPETIYMDIDSYFKQDVETKKVLDTAISFAVSAFEIKESQKTLSVISAFTTIETMVNFEFRDLQPEKCENCSQLKFSVVKKYRDYLLKYIGDSPQNKKKFNALYSLRSKIVHTGQRFKTENLFAEVSTEQSDQELMERLEITQLSRLAIVQWLLKNNPE